MKKILFLFAFALVALASLSRGDITAPYTYPMYAGFEERAESKGYVITSGNAQYGTSLSLSGSGTQRYAGDSALVGFNLRPNCLTNQPDSCYNPHRAYVNFRNRGFALFTTHIIGEMAQCPCWFQTWYYVSNMRLHGHVDTLGNHLTSDWNSILTVTPDTTDNGDSVVTINEDTTNYLYLFHVPAVGQNVHSFQRTPANDPTGAMRLTRDKWHLIQVYYDNHITHSASVWMDGFLQSSAHIDGRLPGVAQYHFGLYTSPACSTGTVLNDEQMFTPIHDSLEGIFRFKYFPFRNF